MEEGSDEGRTGDSLGAVQEDASNEAIVAMPLAESPPPQGASGGRASGYEMVDLSPALPNFARGPSVRSLGALPNSSASHKAISPAISEEIVATRVSITMSSSLPRPPSESSCQVSMVVTDGDTAALASDDTSPPGRRRLFNVGSNQQTDTSPSNLRPPDQRTAATRAAGGEQQATPTGHQVAKTSVRSSASSGEDQCHDQCATSEDLRAELKRLQDHIGKTSILEKEAEEKLHMIKAKTMRTRPTRTAQSLFEAPPVPSRATTPVCYHARAIHAHAIHAHAATLDRARRARR